MDHLSPTAKQEKKGTPLPSWAKHGDLRWASTRGTDRVETIGWVRRRRIGLRSDLAHSGEKALTAGDWIWTKTVPGSLRMSLHREKEPVCLLVFCGVCYSRLHESTTSGSL